MDEEMTALGDRYEIGPVIGRGGMAEVHEGRDVRLGRRVAIKIMRADLARDPSFQARFRREAQSAAGLNHPNIVAVYDTGEEIVGDGSQAIRVPFIVMEYVDGMTLRELLNSGRRLLPERALEITAGILAALDYSHRHGIVHRDIKPANIMLTRTGEAKVMDFGIARALADSSGTMTQTSAVLGTAQYLSPEQARGEIVDARSDLYSTGCLLYELLTTRPPFTGDSPVSIAYQHVSEAAAPPSQVDSSVPAAVDAVVMKALAKDPGDRYSSAAEMRADVERAMAGLPVTAAMVPAALVHEPTMAMAAVGGAAVAPPPEPRRSPWVWIGVTIAVLALIGGIALLGLKLFGSPEIKKVAVPTLSGLTVPQARAKLATAGLVLGQQTPATSPDKPKDTIIGQQPGAGEQSDAGQPVNVTVSTGKEQTTVPNLVGLASVNDARAALTNNKLILGKVTAVNSDQPEGYVLASEPSSGTQVPEGSSVAISVSNGKVAVPDVQGKTEAQARSDLANAGFEVNVVNQEDGTVP
ncbi:MAG: Stk1 family PASTA domain-containing Ser/Thr kinase, partial [Actinomycetes bacterium]